MAQNDLEKKETEFSNWQTIKNVFKARFFKGSILALLLSYFINISLNTILYQKPTLVPSLMMVPIFLLCLSIYALYLIINYRVREVYSVRNYGQHGKGIIKSIKAYKHPNNYNRTDIATYEGIEYFDVYSKDNKYRGIPIGTVEADNEIGFKYAISHKTEDMAKIVGATGSGKTQLVLLPLIDILSIPQNDVAQESMLITDPKGELYKKMSPLLKKRGYEVYIQNTLDPINSNKVNALSIVYQTQLKIDKLVGLRNYKDLNEQEKEEFASLTSFKNKQIAAIAKLFTADPSSKEKVWQEAAYSTLVGFINFTLHFLSEKKKVKRVLAPKVEKKLKRELEALIKTFKNELVSDKKDEYLKEIDNINLQLQEIKEQIEVNNNFEELNFTSMTMKMQELLNIKTNNGSSTMLDDIFNTLEIYNPARLANSTSNAAAGQTKASVLMTLLNSLSIFFDTSVAAMSCANDIDFFKLDEGKPKVIFCVVPDDDTSRHKITSTFIESLYSALREISRNKKSGKLERRWNIIGEEIANVCDILNFSEKLSVARGSNIRFILALQSDKQLEKKYGKEESEIISQNCRLKMMILSNDIEEIEKFIKSAGKRTVQSESLTYNRDKSLPATRSLSLQEKELISNSNMREIQFSEMYIDLIRYPMLEASLPPYFLSNHIDNYDELEKINLDNKNLIDISEIEILEEFSDMEFNNKLVLDYDVNEFNELINNPLYKDYKKLLSNKLLKELTNR